MLFERYGEKEKLVGFEPIYLDQIKGVELMNRIDTKYVIERGVLNEILPQLTEEYWALEVEGTKMNAYATQYFDTSDFKFYLDHHNGKGNRFKVRIRKYIESDIYFLEVKNKFKGRTEKKRIRIGDFEEKLSEGSKEYVEAVVGDQLVLNSKLWNSFDRVTLVNKKLKERLTIDMNLSYQFEEDSFEFNHFVIAELKQEKINRSSLFYKVMKKYGIRPNSFSKYCVGAITLNPFLKANNFKKHMLLIDKLQ
ncbi:MAG: polyphosphate polymerase domain-containing protein [Crocinitomicaceae bacterium]